MKFNKGDYFNHDNKKIEILDVLGEGGQGEVYLVDVLNQKLAFKYYKEIPSADSQWYRHSRKTLACEVHHDIHPGYPD